MIVLGIDPGLATTGWGVITGTGASVQLVDYGVIKTEKNKAHADRLLMIQSQLVEILEKYSPDLIGVEELFFYKNVKTALKVAEARGVVMLTIAQAKVSLLELTPLQVKQSVTSYGRADKKQVQRMIKAILKLSHVPQPDDAADALAIAVTVSQIHKQTQQR